MPSPNGITALAHHGNRRCVRASMAWPRTPTAIEVSASRIASRCQVTAKATAIQTNPGPNQIGSLHRKRARLRLRTVVPVLR